MRGAAKVQRPMCREIFPLCCQPVAGICRIVVIALQDRLGVVIVMYEMDPIVTSTRHSGLRYGFCQLRACRQVLRQIVGDISIVIAGNKVDLDKNRAVPEDEAVAYAESVGASHVHTSAKQNKGLDQAFTDLSTRMAKRRKKPGMGPGQARRPIVLVDDNPPPAPKRQGCCN